MELEEAIKILKEFKETGYHTISIKYKWDRIKANTMIELAIEVILNHLTKQDKMIELMSRFIDTELSSEHLSKVLKIEVKPLETYREDIKQYFEKKAEEIDNK